jgi:hypothetical protein
MSEWSAVLRSSVRMLPLHRLVLRDTNTGDAGLRTLSREIAAVGAALPARCPDAASAVDRSGSRLDTSVPLPLLEVLDLSGVGLTDAGPLSLVVTACPRLQSLDLASNHLGSCPTGLAVLCTALRLHPCVEVVNLSHNCIHGTRGGPVMAGLAELLVARSVRVAEVHAGAPVVTTRPLRALYLSHNLLGSYYLARGSMCAEATLAEMTRTHAGGAERDDYDALSPLRDCVYDVSTRHLSSSSNAGDQKSACHETVTAFPLVTALYLNNSVCTLDLRHNGLPDSLLEYVEAKVHVNRRTQQQVRSLESGAQLTRAIPAERVEEVLHTCLQRGLQQVHNKVSLKSDALVPPVVTDSSASAGVASTCKDGDGRWTADEVQELLARTVRGIAAELLLT